MYLAQALACSLFVICSKETLYLTVILFVRIRMGSLFAFAGWLPEPEAVHQLVSVGVEALLTFPGASDLNALLYNPLYNERHFIITAT